MRVPTRLASVVCSPFQSGVTTMARTTYKQFSFEEVHHQAHPEAMQLQEHFAQAADLLEDILPDILSLTAFPVSHWQKVWTKNPWRDRTRISDGATPWWISFPTERRHGIGGRGASRTARRMGGRPLSPHLHQGRRCRNPASNSLTGGLWLRIIDQDDLPHTT